jgi:hypothetical protein
MNDDIIVAHTAGIAMKPDLIIDCTGRSQESNAIKSSQRNSLIDEWNMMMRAKDGSSHEDVVPIYEKTSGAVDVDNNFLVIICIIIRMFALQIECCDHLT